MRDSLSRVVFGGFDGCTSLIGVVAGLIVAHASILPAVAGLAVASAVGMGFGDYLGGSSGRLALVMGAATLIGSFVPAVPAMLIPGPAGLALSGVLVLALGVLIAEARAPSDGRRRSYGMTGGMLLVTALLSAAVAVASGAVG